VAYRLIIRNTLTEIKHYEQLWLKKFKTVYYTYIQSYEILKSNNGKNPIITDIINNNKKQNKKIFIIKD